MNAKWMNAVRALAASCLCAATAAAHAQANPTATKASLQVGGGYTFASPDYLNSATATNPYIQGYTIFADLQTARRFGIEGEYHGLTVITPRDFGQTSLLFGPRFAFSMEDRARLYVKAMGGMGHMVFQTPSYPAHSDTYGVFTGGGGIEFRLSRHINLRPIDVEYQFWPGFPSPGLKPFLTTISVAWVK